MKIEQRFALVAKLDAKWVAHFAKRVKWDSNAI
jgi:hypothetical protein